MKHSDPIVISSKYISQATIDQCIERYQLIRHDIAPLLTILVESELIDIDILLFAHLLLFKSEAPRLKIHLEFKQAQSYPLILKLRNYMVYAILNLGMEVFDLTYPDNSGYRTANITNTLTVDFVALSGKVIPLLFITQESYRSLFEQDISHLLGAISFEYEADHVALFNKYSSYAKMQVVDIRRNTDSVQQLARFAYYNALFEAKIFAFYYDQAYTEHKITRPKLKLGSLQGKEAYELFDSIRYVFDELRTKPAIYQFIYATFLSSELLPNYVNSKTKVAYQNAIINLWQLTQHIVSGLVELAKNIYQHTSNGTGVITGRVYRSGVWEQLKTDHAEAGDLIDLYTRQFKKELREKELAFLDLNIIDAGTDGVTNMLFKNSEPENYPELLSSELEEDRQRIRNREIRFRHFLNPQSEVLLNQQAKRASAHLGLLAFAKLIGDIGGLLRASSWEGNESEKKREHVLIPEYVPAEQAPLSALGTNYHVVIPFRPFAAVEKTDEDTFDQTPLSNAPILRGIETLLQYRLVDGMVTGELPIDSRQHIILRLSPKKANIYNRTEEAAFWAGLIDTKTTSRLTVALKQPDNLIGLDLDGSNINGSQLFRLLGKWELQFPNKALLVYNLPTTVYKELKEINELFVARKDHNFAYWNAHSLVTFYSFVRYGRDQLRFYFTDMLWGRTREDFLNLNKLIRKTSFNATCLLEDPHEKIKPLSEADSHLISRFPMFHSGTTLLPLDLLLTTRNEISLFEHNAMVLLQKEIGSI